MERVVDLILFPISLFSGKPLAVSIALLILGSAVSIWLYIHIRFERRFIQIYNEMTNFVVATRKADDSAERKVAKVAGKFKKSALSEGWQQYSASLDYSNGIAFNHSDPAAYFASDRMYGHNYVKWSSTLGGVFLTVGLFFTFVGLSAALLQVAGDGHTEMAPEQLRSAVQNILGISSVKFITSLAGILAYIFWSLIARFQADSQEKAVDRLVSEIRRLSTYVSPEKLLFEQLKTQKAQHQQFQTFGTELAVAIGQQIQQALSEPLKALPDAIGQQIQQALSGTLEALPDAIGNSVGSKVATQMTPVRDELLSIGRQIGKAGGDIATGAGDVFSQVWKTGIETHMNAFGEQMGKMISALQGLPEAVRQTETSLGSEIGAATKLLTETMGLLGANFATQQTTMMGAVTDFNARVADIPNVVADASRASAAAVGASVETSLGRISEITAKAGEASAKQLSDEVAKIAASLAASANSLRSASAGSSQNISQAGALLGAGIRDSIKAVEETSLKSSRELAQTITALSSIVNGLSSRLEQTTQLLEIQQTSLTQAGATVSNASTSLSNSAGNVERAVSPLDQAVTTMRTAMEQVSAASTQLRETSASEQKIAQMLNGTVEKAGDAFAQQASQFGVLQTRVRETTEHLVAGVSRLADEISMFMTKYDKAITDSIGSLENALLNVTDLLEPAPKKPTSVRG